MKIVVLAQGLSTAGGKSVGTNIISSLANVRSSYEYLLILPDDQDYRILKYPDNAKTIFYASSSMIERIRFDKYVLPKIIKEWGPDFIWGLGNMGLTRPPCKQAILLHKSQMVYPTKHRPKEFMSRRIVNLLIKYQLKRSLSATQLVFCQTSVMKRRFIDVFDFAGKVEIMPNAVSKTLGKVNYTYPDKLRLVKRKYKFFVLTRYYTHKNLELIIECFDKYRDELREISCVLTIAEDQHPRAGVLLDKIRRLGLQAAIINVGPVEQTELAGYYRFTDGLLLPTLLESFSGTYIEAMAFNRPILTSDLDFAKDVCGKAALYFNPWSIASLKDAMLELVANASLIADLVKHGEERKVSFQLGWDDIVDSAMQCIEDVA